MGAILVIIRDRHLSCPCEDLKQDVGCRIPPAHKVTEVLEIVRPDKLKQLDLHKQVHSGWSASAQHCKLRHIFTDPTNERLACHWSMAACEAGSLCTGAHKMLSCMSGNNMKRESTQSLCDNAVLGKGTSDVAIQLCRSLLYSVTM